MPAAGSTGALVETSVTDDPPPTALASMVTEVIEPPTTVVVVLTLTATDCPRDTGLGVTV